MRRCKDDWVNATQILKCCDFPKAKRTKILEKGVQQGMHEKIQGGYGRFQGTWIPLPDALRLAATYSLAPELAPVLYLDFTNLNIPRKVKPAAGSVLNKDGTPVKRKYTKKIKKDEDTPSKKMKKNEFDQMNQSGMDVYNNDFSRGSISNQSPQNMGFNNPQNLPPTFQQSEFIGLAANASVPSFTSHNQAVQNEFQNYQMQYQRLQQQQMQQQYMQGNNFGQIPNQVAPQPQQQQQQQQQPHMMGNFLHQSKLPLSSQSTNDTHWSHDEQKDSDTSISSTDSANQMKKFAPGQQSIGLPQQQLAPQLMEEDSSYAAQLLKFFSDDNAPIPYFIHNPPYDFNINEAIDDEGHTPLHWAASIGNANMIHLLISKGANPLVVNNFGLNPLSKLISFNNCYELKNFSRVLDDLELCLINTDINGRTPLHYLCQFAKVKSKYKSLRYYIGIISNKLTSLSNQNSLVGANGQKNPVNLIKNVIDHQDVNGDTCLHLAARSNSPKLVKLLLSYGTRDDLVNVNNETARMLIMNYNLLGPNYESIKYQLQNQLQPPQPIPQKLSANQQKPNQKYYNAPSSTSLYKKSSEPIMSTPIQSKFSNDNMIETPDTQKTTVQEDDIDEDTHDARVNKDQLDNLIKTENEELSSGNQHHGNIDDNKENIFIDDSFKNYESMATGPKSHNINNHTSSNQISLNHQPLAVISERTVESTPIKIINQDEKNSLLKSSFTHNHKPNPPKLDDNGNIIELGKSHYEDQIIPNQLQKGFDKDNDEIQMEELPKLSMNDLSYMVNGMINSLNDSYVEEINKINRDFKRIKKVLVEKKNSNELVIEKIKININKNGIENFDDIDEGKRLLEGEINKFKLDLDEKQLILLKEFEKNQAIELAIAVKNEESNVTEETESAAPDAVELSNLQVERIHLTNQIVDKIKNYGIDSKMYKYRKLISLSCGLKVEDIDGLIDGIEESLMETTST